MIVMKFGGTSLGDATRIRSVVELVRDRIAQRPLIVVSALAGVTNRLIAVATAARAGDRASASEHVQAFADRHDELVDGLELPALIDAEARLVIRQAHAQLADLAQGALLLGECTPRTRDAIASLGELASHRLLALVLRAHDVRSTAVDPRALLRTDEQFGEAVAQPHAIAKLAAELVTPLLASGVVPVTGGFVGGTADGVATTLGRGGSDLSATLLGVALDAEEVIIWTDVDGLMTADPRVVPGARTLSEASFQEAAELAYFGARVLHPATIKPAVERRIPVRVLNTFRPEARGTLIGPAPVDDAREARVRAVAWKESITLVSVDSPRMLGAVGFLSRVFGVFERHRTPVDVVTTSEVSVSMTIDRADRLDVIQRELSDVAQVRVEANMSLICIVGWKFLESPRLVGDILQTLDGIPLRMVSLGSSAINLSLVVAQDDAREVVKRIHARFIEEMPMSAPLHLALLGVGRMGAMVEEIAVARGHRILARLDVAESGEPLPEGIDVAIDFSVASAVLPHAAEAARRRCALVIGTTGWDREGSARQQLAGLVRESGIGVLAAPNFSFAAHLFRRIVEEAARLAAADPELDAWIEETHHRMKADHPSGTALALARVVLEQLPRKRGIVTELADGPVDPEGLVVRATRGGWEPGLHRFVLDGPEECITLEHRARSRRAFALGAVRAAEWIRGRSGLFTMDDLLGHGATT